MDTGMNDGEGEMEQTKKDSIQQMESKDFIMEPAIFTCLKR